MDVHVVQLARDALSLGTSLAGLRLRGVSPNVGAIELLEKLLCFPAFFDRSKDLLQVRFKIPATGTSVAFR